MTPTPKGHRFGLGSNLFRALLSAGRMNEPPDGINEVATHLQNLGLMSFFGKVAEIFVGKIVAAPDGETTFSDENYWVKMQVISTDTTDSDEKPNIDDETVTGHDLTVHAANLTEWNAGSHALAEDGTVMVLVFGFDSRDGTGGRQYVFTSGGTGGGGGSTTGSSIWIEITQVDEFGDGDENKWYYQWKQKQRIYDDEYDTWIDHPSGLHSTVPEDEEDETPDTRARNSAEFNNDGAGVEGNGVNMSNLAAGFSMKPIPVGRILRCVKEFDPEAFEGEGRWCYSIDEPNAIDGVCEEE